MTVELSRSDLYEVSQFSNTSSHVIGVWPNYTEVRYIPMAQGRFLDDQDVSDRRRVAVLGAKAALLLFPGRPMVGETITINGTDFKVVGAVDKISRGNNDYDDQKLYIPVTTMQELYPLKGDNIAQDALTSIQYQPTKPGDATAAVAAVHRVIAERHGFDPSMKDAFQEWDTIKEMKMVGAIFNAMDVFLGGVGIVTLGLGAVGIINIMLVSVSERTQRDRFAQSAGRDEEQHHGAVLLGRVAADGGEWSDWHCGFGGVDGAAAGTADGQDAGLGSAAAGAVVGGAGDGDVGFERDCCRTVSGKQGGGDGSGRGVAERLIKQLSAVSLSFQYAAVIRS